MECLRRFFIAAAGAAFALASGTAASAAKASNQQNWDDCDYTQDPDRAIRGCTAIIESGRAGRDDLLEAYNRRGFAYQRRGEFKPAVADFTQAISHSPRDATAYSHRGFALMKEGELDRALTDFNQAIRLRPYFANAYSGRGTVYHYKGLRDLADSDLDKAIRLRPDDGHGYSNRAFVFNLRGEHDRAIADLDEAIRLNKVDGAIFVERGDAFMGLGEFARAVADYTEATRLAPGNVSAFVKRGSAYFNLADFDRCIADSTHALSLNLRHGIAYSNRGAAYLGKGQYDRAIADLNRAIRLRPDAASPYDHRGFAYYSLGEFERALADFDEALRREPDFVPAFANRGLSFEKLGQREKAMADYRKALSTPVKVKKRLTFIKALAAAREHLSALEAAASTVKPREATRPGEGIMRDGVKLGETVKPSHNAPPVGRRAALIIGNSAYENVQHITNPEHDATDVAAALKRLGFDVTLKENLGVAAMRTALRDFEDKSAGAEWATVFYAGHGMQLDGKTWLIPVDARLERASDAPDEAIMLDRALDRLRPASGLRLVMLDACRNNPFLARMNMGADSSRGEASRGLARIEPQHGELVFYAARDGQTANDGEDRHSPFTAALLSHIEEPNLELGRLVRKVTSDVVKTTGARQEPFVYGRLPDQDFYFRPPGR